MMYVAESVLLPETKSWTEPFYVSWIKLYQVDTRFGPVVTYS